LSTTNLPHYNELFVQPWQSRGYRVIYQPSCLINAYNGACWPIQYPEVKSWDNTVVIMHCQDFVSICNNRCPELEAIEQHFGTHADQVVVVHWNLNLHKVYSGPLKLIYFPTHSYELLVNLAKSQSQWLKNFYKPRAHVWQCLNGVPRRHRRLVVNYLRGKFNNGILSFAEEIPLPTWSYNNYFGCENEKNWQKLQYVYTDCNVNIVTETQYAETPGIISEKTLMAFLAQQVPILIGYQGIVDDCESLGFDLFRDVVDTSYDYSTDELRWQQAIESNQQLLNNGIDREVLKDRLQSNLQIALNFPSTLVQRYYQQVNRTIQENFLDLSKD